MTTDSFKILSINPSEYKGTIYSGDALLFRGFPISEEYIDQDLISNKCNPQVDLSKSTIYECLEGTLVRVFYHNDKFYTCTSKKLDAFNSKWAAMKTSFGQSFASELRKLTSWGCECKNDNEFLTEFYSKYLCKSKKYIFMLRTSKDERIVCDANLIPGVVYLGYEDDNFNIDLDDEIKLDADLIFPKNRKITHLTSLLEIAKYVRDCTSFKTLQGILIFQQNERDVKTVKIVSKEYSERFSIRANVSSLKFRYLELRKTRYDLDLFFELYPHMIKVAKDLEDKIYNVCKSLHSLYLRIYVSNELNVIISDKQQIALKIIHRQYISTRQKTTPTRVNDILTLESATILNGLLREHYLKNKYTTKNEEESQKSTTR